MWCNFDNFHIFQHFFFLMNMNLYGPIWISHVWNSLNGFGPPYRLYSQCYLLLSPDFFETFCWELSFHFVIFSSEFPQWCYRQLVWPNNTYSRDYSHIYIQLKQVNIAKSIQTWNKFFREAWFRHAFTYGSISFTTFKTSLAQVKS